jgi:hypothetical protein
MLTMAGYHSNHLTVTESMFCTSNTPSLLQNVPYGSVVVTKKNWKSYFGPYAARSFIYARKRKPEEKEVSSQAKRRKCDQFS